jgi:hypothetical protein
MRPLWARELAAALLSGGGWACHEAGTEAVLGHGAAEALTGHVAQRHWGHACCHRRRGTIGVPPNVEDSGLCNGAGAVQLGGTDNGPTSAARPNPAAMELPKLAMAPSGPDSAGPSGPSAKSPRACWAACPGQAHVVGGGAQVVARHVEARRHDCVPDVGIQKLSVGRIVRARDQSSPDSPELDEPDPGAKMFHPSKMELSPGPDAAGEARDCSALGMAEISWPSVLCWVPAGVATADEAA